MAIIKSLENDHVIKESHQASTKGYGASNSKPVDMTIYRENRAHRPAYTYNRAKGKAGDEIASGMDQMSYGGGGGGMDNLELRVQNLERGLNEIREVLKEKPSKTDLSLVESNIKLEIKNQTSAITTAIQDSFSKLPDEDRIKVIFTEQIKSQDVATNTYVDKQTTIGNNKLVYAILALIGAIVVGLAIQVFIKFVPPSTSTSTKTTTSTVLDTAPKNNTTTAP